jgi:biopolymer transport protein ExbD
MAGLEGNLPGTERQKRDADFSLATVNIVLLLVFFFLITGTLVETDELSVDLAETQDLPLDRLPRPLLLMKPDGDWSLDGDSVSPATLTLALEDSFERLGTEARILHLLPDRNVRAEDLVAILRRPDLAGVQIKLVTLRLRSTQ